MSYENSRLEPGEQLFLRGCGPGGRAHGGFVWPLTVGATVEAPDWSSEPYCGRGLHGNLNGEGDPELLVCRGPGLVVAACGAVDLLGKHKFQRCRILFVGVSLQEAATWLASHPDLPRGSAVHYGTATAGYAGTATAGHRGTATAGDGGTATAGRKGTATAGDRGTATAGDGGTATAGRKGTATAGDSGSATAGNYGTATAGDSGSATAGNYGTATAGNYGTATAGDGGSICIQDSNGRMRCKEIESEDAGKMFRLSEAGDFEVAQ